MIGFESEFTRLTKEKERAIYMRMEELKKRLDASTNPDEKDLINREGEKLGEILRSLHREGGPPGLYATLTNAHQIYFCIKDKDDELKELKR